MRRITTIATTATAVAVAAVCSAVFTGAGATAAPGRVIAGGSAVPSGTWHKAIEVPGSGVLNKGNSAQVESVSCASAGNCTAGGTYAPGSHVAQAFVVGENKGHWGKAVQVPGTGVLNAGGNASVTSVSCALAGNCAAVGFYADSSGNRQVFVVSKKGGRWARAIEIPGTGVLNAAGDAAVTSVSCGSAGNCAAGGDYEASPASFRAFVVSEKNGHWGKAAPVLGPADINAGGEAEFTSVSCGSAGNCAAAGFFLDQGRHPQPLVISEKKGTWGKAIEVPGSGGLNQDGDAQMTSVSCASAGNCAAAGFYRDLAGHPQLLVVSERNGTWGRTLNVPGARRLNRGGDAEVTSVSCATAGNCVVAGFYRDGSGHNQALVVSEKRGVWGKAKEVPGSGRLNRGGDAVTVSVSCASPGNCAAAGLYTDGSSKLQAFVVNDRNGSWAKAVQIAGLGRLNKAGDAGIGSVSCASADHCSVGGHYGDGAGHFQAFVAKET